MLKKFTDYLRVNGTKRPMGDRAGFSYILDLPDYGYTMETYSRFKGKVYYTWLWVFKNGISGLVIKRADSVAQLQTKPELILDVGGFNDRDFGAEEFISAVLANKVEWL